MTIEPAESQEPHYSWNETIRTIIIAVVLAVGFRSFAFEPFHIPSGSMKSNLLVGDYLFVSKFSYGYSRYSFPFGFEFFEGRKAAMDTPQRGDVAVFRLPSNPRIDYIKRVMGLPGDTIQVQGGVVFINGKPLPKTYKDDWADSENPAMVLSMPRYEEVLPEGKKILVLDEKQFGEADDTPVFRVPEGHYFMMGDNRDNSRDSRYDEVGFVPVGNFVGKAQMIFFSIDSTADLVNPLTWPGALRLGRFFHFIH